VSQAIKPFLMFEGQAERAMNFYVSLFPGGAITSIQRYGPGEAGAEGSVMKASFTIRGQTLLCIDSPVKHDFSFTPSISLWVDCVTEAEIDALFASLCDGGGVMMPLAVYPFAAKFAWVADRFGVSWQLNLAEP
jgi:predicted 3-demethylubiquinone-9 3-methyltransferase (glyoxalase superfamily)